MRTSLARSELADYVRRLLERHFPDEAAAPLERAVVDLALDRVSYCFDRIRRKYYQDERGARFDHLNSDHMASFLWFLGNTAWRETGSEDLATRLFYLNKIMHGLDLFYSVAMPDIFILVHPVGTVLGRATYSDYLVVYQNCTVGADIDVYPAFGEGVIFYSRSTVLGACQVGDNVVFASNSFLIDTDVPGDSVVVGQYPSHRILPNRRPVRARCFETPAAADA
jgi:serine O-acetyltransferase